MQLQNKRINLIDRKLKERKLNEHVLAQPMQEQKKKSQVHHAKQVERKEHAEWRWKAGQSAITYKVG